MQKHEHESEDMQMLKEYLSQYFRAKKTKRRLEQRLRDARAELDHPLHSSGYNAAPPSTTNNVSNAPAALTIRIDDIEERIDDQSAQLSAAMLEVMKIMDYLPLGDKRRDIIEERHIDCMSWRQIVKEENLTRTPCSDLYREGLETLLEYKKVKKVIKEYHDSRTSDTPYPR